MYAKLIFMYLELSQSEENYLKSIFKLKLDLEKDKISTNEIAEDLQTKASSVTEMIKKLSDKNLVTYEKYKGFDLTNQGSLQAIEIIRKHRLWETFLVDKLGFGWEEVHEIAEQLEHIQSKKLTNKLSEFLNHPKFDPHGDLIFDENGKFPVHDQEIKLKDILIGQKAEIIKIASDNRDLLDFLNKNNVEIGTILSCTQKYDFDDAMQIKINMRESIIFSKKVIKNIRIKLIK